MFVRKLNLVVTGWLQGYKQAADAYGSAGYSWSVWLLMEDTGLWV